MLSDDIPQIIRKKKKYSNKENGYAFTFDFFLLLSIALALVFLLLNNFVIKLSFVYGK